MRKPRDAWILPLLVILWMASPTLARCEEPSTPEQIVSQIDPAAWYLGSDVQAAMLELILIGQQEAKTTAEEAVKTAVTPILADNARLTVERDEYKESWEQSELALQRANRRTIYIGLGAGALGAALATIIAVIAK